MLHVALHFYISKVLFLLLVKIMVTQERNDGI